jgi:transposase-like protein
MLSRWKKELRDGVMENNDKSARSINELNDARKKIKALEKELKRLRDENAVLKKAERIFPGKK